MRYGDAFGSYQLEDLPGCSQVGVSHSVYIKPRLRGMKKGGIQHRERLAHATKLGYDLLICTVASTNTVEIHILEKNGWKQIADFRSSKTGNLVRLYAKEIVQ